MRVIYTWVNNTGYKVVYEHYFPVSDISELFTKHINAHLEEEDKKYKEKGYLLEKLEIIPVKR